jgi:NADPH2:quinone reductase
MKATYIDKVGPPENIRYGDLSVPALGKGDVLVKVSAVCVNPVDTYIRSGQFPMELPFPFVVGRDVAGVVQAVGSAVTRFHPGDRVWCNNQGYHGRQGTFAMYVAVSERLLYPLPAGVNDPEAVAFVHSGLTACLGLGRADRRPGASLFVNGGSGNLGSAVVQLARGRGARVLATAGGPQGLAWCQALGAERVVNYRTGDVDREAAEFAPGGVDGYWDTSGKPDFDRAIARVAPRGRVIVMAGLTALPPFPVGPFYLKDCALHGFAVTNATGAELRAAPAEINQWLVQGKVRVRIDRVLPLSEAAPAHRVVEDHAPLAGKIVLTPERQGSASRRHVRCLGLL